MAILTIALPFLIAFFAGFSVFFLLWALPDFSAFQRTDTQRRSKFIGMPLVIALGAALDGKIPPARMKATKQRLESSGIALSAGEYYALCILAVPCFAVLGVLIDFLADTAPLLTILFAFGGAFYPGLWVKGAAQKRRDRVFRDLPDLLDILRLAVAAGLDFSSALRVVVDSVAKGPLLAEFEKVEHDIVLGRPRSEALQRMSDRLQIPEMNSFVMAVKQADELGAPISPILAVQSEMARNRRWQLAEVALGKVPTKLLGPLVLCIFPASFIVLFTPLILDYLASGF